MCPGSGGRKGNESRKFYWEVLVDRTQGPGLEVNVCEYLPMQQGRPQGREQGEGGSDGLRKKESSPSGRGLRETLEEAQKRETRMNLRLNCSAQDRI